MYPDFKGVWLEDTYVRQYPYNSLACDVIGFVRDMDGLDFIGACEKLNNAFSLGLPIGQKRSRRQAVDDGKKAFERRKAMEAEKHAAKQAELALWRAYDEWLSYLLAAEKIAPKRRLGALTDEYIDAVMLADAAEDRLEEAEYNYYLTTKKC